MRQGLEGHRGVRAWLEADGARAPDAPAVAVPQPPPAAVAPAARSAAAVLTRGLRALAEAGAEHGGTPALLLPRRPVEGRLDDLGPLGRGGQARLRRVWDRALGRQVAMKVLDPALAHLPRERERFLAEARLTARLDHPNIPAVYELAEDEGGLTYFTLTLVEGRTLEAALRASEQGGDREAALLRALQAFLRVCDAVAFAHSRGVLHCDLKPGNVMVGAYGEVYVMDWGIARERVAGPGDVARWSGPDGEGAGSAVGTAAYMAPEQARGRWEQVDERTDVFGLGALLYRIVVGRAPYGTQRREEALARAVLGDVVPPEVAAPGVRLPRRLCHIALKALARERRDRHPDVHALQAEVQAYLRGEGSHPLRFYRAGELVVREGDAGEEAYVVVRGRCEAFKLVQGRREGLSVMGPGDVFGETAMLARHARSASVEALEDTTVACVSRESLERELGTTHVTPLVVRALAERFHALDVHADALRQEAARARVRDAVQAHLLRHGVRTQDGALEAPWAPLQARLCAELKVTPDEASALVRAVPGVQLEPDILHWRP